MAVSWRKIKTEYVTGTDSYRAIAARHGISLSTLSKVAKKEGWAEARRRYGDEVATRTAEAMCAHASAREVERFKRLCGAADRMAEELEKVLEDPRQFYRHIVSESTQKVVGGKVEARSGATVKVFKKADIRAMKDYVATLGELSRTMRDLYWLPGMLDQHAMEMAAEKIRIEQEKLALLGGSTEEDGKTGVVMIAPVLAEQEEATGDAGEGTDGGDGAQG